MAIDLFFLVAGIGLVIWGMIGVINPELSWRINGRTGIRLDMIGGRQSPGWPQQSRRFGWFGIVIGVFNIVLSVARLI